MNTLKPLHGFRLLLLLAVAAAACGCRSTAPFVHFKPPLPPAPLGTMSQGVWIAQEENAEASKFVIYDHEFKQQDVRLNTGGEDHVKQIAARIARGANYPVIIERSMTDDKVGEYKYPVNVDPELDNERRALVVAALQRQGIADADERVVVTTALTAGYSAIEAERAYLRGTQINSGLGTFGGGFGGLGGFGGFGNFGGFGGGFF